MLTEHNANPNHVVREGGMAAIHYAAGMENNEFAEYAMKLILKCKGNPNLAMDDKDTPLHIAASWNRALIVNMLLVSSVLLGRVGKKNIDVRCCYNVYKVSFPQDHGADASLQNEDGETAINCAIYEGHHEIVEIFKKHIFESKLEGGSSKSAKPSSPFNPLKAKKNRIDQLLVPPVFRNASILTPNRNNYNFEATSPYYINITQRRKQAVAVASIMTEDESTIVPISVDPLIGLDSCNEDKTEEDTVIGTNSNSSGVETVVMRQNLFHLTEANLSKHLESYSKVNRTSLVDKWRDRVDKSRKRQSVLPSEGNELDTFIEEFCAKLTDSHISTPISSIPQAEQIAVIDLVSDTCSESFVTAQEIQISNEQQGLLRPNDMTIDDVKCLIKSPKRKGECNVQVEKFIHTDNESDIVFYEEIYHRDETYGTAVAGKRTDDDDELNGSMVSTVPSTEVTIPLDYDTDDLRKELTMLGQPPGPITKNTKRLYLKKLIKYKRANVEPTGNNGQQAIQSNKHLLKFFVCFSFQSILMFVVFIFFTFAEFSLELEQTMRPENEEWLNNIVKHMSLEEQMSKSFFENQTKRFREGNLKTSFIYLLIDPRISNMLPVEAQVSRR